MPIVINNRTLARSLRDSYTSAQLDEIYALLRRSGTLHFPALSNGLYPASNLQQDSQYTGYRYVWIRDNVYVALAHALNGELDAALRTADTLMRYFLLHAGRLRRILSGELDYREPMNRPHIRFNGEDLSELPQKWAHAENDALGYFLLLFCRLHAPSASALPAQQRELLTLLAFYLEFIRYWEDEDSGHWEEARKIEASSIGIVLAGLRELRAFLHLAGGGFRYGARELSCDSLDELIAMGRESLDSILPSECVQPEAGKQRRYDAALLFLIYPAEVVTTEVASRITADVTAHLQGDHGVRRYLGDSFWSPNYKQKLRPEERTVDVSDRMATRDRYAEPGLEAQWCVFDPILSILHGLRYQSSRSAAHLELQTQYFNRSLGQLTAEESRFGPLRCPELYYLEDGRYVPNDTVPLLWTQANLWMAFHFLRRSLALQLT